MNTLNLYPKPHPQTAGRVIDGEAVLMLSDSSQINVLNTVGSRIFELADGSHNLAEISDIIAMEFDVTPETARTDVLAFVEGLVERDIMILSES